MQFVLIIAFIAVAGVLAYYGWQAAKKRREALAALADELGWQFRPEKDRAHDERYSHFEIFRRGHSRVAYNSLRGTLTVDVAPCAAHMGDFCYRVTRGSGKSRSTSTYEFSYLIVHLPYMSLPDLLIRLEGMFDKLAGAFGFDDIDFESAEFSRRFYVRSPDKRFAYDVVHPRMMEFLLTTRPPCVDIEHGRCCLSDGEQRWEPAEFKAKAAWLEQFFSHWPLHLTETLDRSD